MEGYIKLFILISAAIITLGSVLYYLGQYLGSRMSLQDLELHTKPHRVLSQEEKQLLTGNFEAREKICVGLGRPLIPKNENVYLIEGPAAGFGLQSMTTKVDQTTIAGIAVEFPTGLSDYLCSEFNVAEVAIAKHNAIVLSLNGVFIDLPAPDAVDPQLTAALQRLHQQLPTSSS